MKKKKLKVWKEVSKKGVPKNEKVFTSTWAWNKKSNITYKYRLNIRGFEQKYGEHYGSTSISEPATNDSTVNICMILMLMAGWVGELIDVKG